MDVEETEGEIMFRDHRSTLGTDPREREANFFAANLLMPSEKFKIHATRHDNNLEELMNEFHVSRAAARFRLENLGLVDTGH